MVESPFRMIIKQPIPANNYDKSRKPIDRIVIHWMAGTLAGANARFKDPASGVSAHYGIEGSTIFQWVEEGHTAYHCGNYTYNQRSIGIEHSADPNRPATEETYQSSGRLIADIAKRYNIPLDRAHIIGHKEVTATQCPGTMDIDKLIKIAKGVTIPPTNGGGSMFEKKAGKLDQVVRKMHSLGIIPYDNTERYLDNQDLENSIQKLKENQGNPDTQNKLNKAKSLGREIAEL